VAKQRGAWRIPGPMFEDWIRLQYADTERGALPERMFHNEQATPSLGSPRTKGSATPTGWSAVCVTSRARRGHRDAT
jgi:hypothetical protein